MYFFSLSIYRRPYGFILFVESQALEEESLIQRQRICIENFSSLKFQKTLMVNIRIQNKISRRKSENTFRYLRHIFLYSGFGIGQPVPGMPNRRILRNRLIAMDRLTSDLDFLIEVDK